jgi:putative hydrolase of the HAD superfamily
MSAGSLSAPWSAANALLATAGVHAGGAEEFWRAYWHYRPSYDRGRLSGRDYWTSVGGAVGTAYTGDRIAKLIEADCSSWRAVDPRMLDLLDVLARSGLTLGLLSNIPPELAAEFLQRHAWLGQFAVLGFSCRIGHVKPEPAAFEWCIRTLGAEPSTILFVDDREENVRAARASGMQGHVFTDVATLHRTLHPGHDTAPPEGDDTSSYPITSHGPPTGLPTLARGVSEPGSRCA